MKIKLLRCQICSSWYSPIFRNHCPICNHRLNDKMGKSQHLNPLINLWHIKFANHKLIQLANVLFDNPKPIDNPVDPSIPIENLITDFTSIDY